MRTINFTYQRPLHLTKEFNYRNASKKTEASFSVSSERYRDTGLFCQYALARRVIRHSLYLKDQKVATVQQLIYRYYIITQTSRFKIP